MPAKRPHPARTSLAVLVATLVGVVLTTSVMAAALSKSWLSLPAALAVAAITTGAYTMVREGPRAVVGLLRR